ncbi:MAG: multidrug effflux MFS transporter [Bdellovibrionales bacterium]
MRDSKSSSHHKLKRLGHAEFVALMALMTSIVALSIDGMLPAFPKIGSDFNVHGADQIQLIIAMLFLGFGFGQFIFGPLSDVFGRKPPIYFGIAVFIIGSALSGFAPNFELFLLGRFLQGFGGAAPRIVSLALIRDEYSGNAMAQITSLIMTIFILVPAIAPALGQSILFLLGWRAIFIVLFAVGLGAWVWFALRQHETLPKHLRKKLTVQQILSGARQTFSQPTTVACMLMTGLIFGIFVGYLGAVQDLFTSLFQVGQRFPAYFAVLALSIGAASFFNSRLVMALGMRRLIFLAFLGMAVLSNLFVLFLTVFQDGPPPLWLFMIYLMLTFFSVGFLFGNLNALAMEPLGHIAGIGSALLGFVQSTISVIIGVFLGRYFHGNVIPLVLSFGIISVLCLFILTFEERFTRSAT